LSDVPEICGVHFQSCEVLRYLNIKNVEGQSSKGTIFRFPEILEERVQ
jgi:hypothetical protein